MNKIVIGIILCVAFACNSNLEERSVQEVETSETSTAGKIRVLNFGTPHLGQTSDANASMINLEDPQEQAALTKMVAKISEFKPTVIFIELGADNNEYIQETFEMYKLDQNDRLNYSDEMNSIGLEVGRLSGTTRIYGIDSQMGFDYPSLVAIANKKEQDSLFVVDMMDAYQKVNSLKLREQYAEMNSTAYKMRTFNFYNFLATQHTENNYEGAIEIAKFFERNLRMYSNLNSISLTADDRVFILTGATHTAYLDIFIGNSKKFVLEDAASYASFSE